MSASPASKVMEVMADSNSDWRRAQKAAPRALKVYLKMRIRIRVRLKLLVISRIRTRMKKLVTG